MPSLVINDITAKQLYQKAAQCPAEAIIGYITMQGDHCLVTQDLTPQSDGIIVHNTQPRPIQHDLKLSNWQKPFYQLIVLTKPQKPGLAAWIEHQGRMASASVHVGDVPIPTDTDTPVLARQRVAYILALTAAVLIVLLTAYVLLPPAPTLP